MGRADARPEPGPQTRPDGDEPRTKRSARATPAHAGREAPRLGPHERLRRAGIAAWAIIGLLGLVAIAGWLLFRIRIILPPLGLALLIIYVVNPAISALERRRVPRLIGTTVSFVVVLGAITTAILAIAPVFSAQIDELGERLPEFADQIAATADRTAESIQDAVGIAIDTRPVTCLLGAQGATEAECAQVLEDIRAQVSDQAGRLVDIAGSVVQGVLLLIVAPLVAFYLLLDLPQIQRDLVNLMPPSHRDEIVDLARRAGNAVGGFFRGQLVVALIVGILSAAGFWLIGLPFWMAIGAIAGLFNLIPFVGPIVGGALGAAVGLFTGGLGLGLAAAFVELVVQQFESHVISPLVMRRAVRLHPATVMLSLLAGGTLAGFWGLLLAVPAVAVGKLLLGHLWATRVLHAQAPGETAAGAP